MNLNELLSKFIEKKASDMHLIGNEYPIFRIDGDLTLDKEFNKLKSEEIREMVCNLLNEEQKDKFEKIKDFDFSYEIKEKARFRINIHFQQGQIGAAFRLIPFEIPTAEEIHFDETIYGLTHLNQGLILITGPTGCGKSTTLATMIEIINQERSSHIITIEDPIEFIFKSKKGIIEQREVYKDTPSFASALKYTLRQDPNVIFVGEMRDPETMAAAITAAETGHLVFSTLHTSNAAQTIHRIIDVFPPYQQQQIMIQLSITLRAIICQQLLPKINGGRIAAREIMINNQAIANLIRQNNIAQIYSIIQNSTKIGMKTMDKALEQLCAEEKITKEIAQHRSIDGETLYTRY